MSNQLIPRPTLRSLRVLAFSGRNPGEARGVGMQLELRQEIERRLSLIRTGQL